MEKREHIVILAAGDFPSHEVPLRALRNADFIVFCDSAYTLLTHSRIHAFTQSDFVVIGDGDSLTAADKHELGNRWIQVDEQDYNDLHKAMQYATTHYPTAHYTILGATGRREDHTLGNISYLVTFAEEYPEADIEMLTDYGRLCAMTGSRTFASFPGQQVSIFTMNPDIPLYSKGLKWELDSFHARRWWQATLNEALGTEFFIRTEGWLVVFQTYTTKASTASV